MTKNPKPSKTDKFIIFNEVTKRYLTHGCDLGEIRSGTCISNKDIASARKFANYETAMAFMQALNSHIHYSDIPDGTNPWGVINFTWQTEIGALPAHPENKEPVVDIQVTTRTEPYKANGGVTAKEAADMIGRNRSALRDTFSGNFEPEEPQPDYSAVQPSHYAQGAGGANFDVIEALYQVLPWEQFKGYMKGNIIKYTVRYDAKNGTEDVEKSAEYTRRLQGYEVRHEAIKKLESEGR